jgi:hypothetical protein
MRQFYTEGGNNLISFPYRYKMKQITDTMIEWCREYDSGRESFRRWHIIWNSEPYGAGDMVQDRAQVPLIQFEWEEAALMFALKFGEYLL